MIELDGRSYIVNTPTENAFEMLDYVNQFMIDNNVKDKNGNIVKFKVSLASPIWLIITGIGYMATVVQKIIYACAQAFNIGSCSDTQVLELAKIARMPRKQGSYTTVTCEITATGGICAITASLEAKASYEGTEYTFKPMYAVNIPNGKTEEVILMCTVTGPVFLESGSITGFTKTVTNLGTFTSHASQPGSGVESINALRTRLLNNEAVSPLAGAIQGLNALDGVTRAVVLFNSNYDSSMRLAGFTVPPKKAIVFVQGYSPKLADEYFKHMSAQTVSEPGEGSSVSATVHYQDYELLNGQTLRFNYFAPISVNVYVRVHVNALLGTDRESSIRQAIAALSNSRNIGENYTQSYILDAINPTAYFPEIIGCDVSTDGSIWSKSTSFNEGNVGLITSQRISFVNPNN